MNFATFRFSVLSAACFNQAKLHVNMSIHLHLNWIQPPTHSASANAYFCYV